MERLTIKENLVQQKGRLKKQAKAKRLQCLQEKLTSNEDTDL